MRTRSGGVEEKSHRKTDLSSEPDAIYSRRWGFRISVHPWFGTATMQRTQSRWPFSEDDGVRVEYRWSTVRESTEGEKESHEM